MNINAYKIRTTLLKFVPFTLPFDYVKVIWPQISLPIFIFIVYLTFFAIAPDRRFYKSSVRKPMQLAILLYIIILTVSFVNFDSRWDANYSILRQFPFYILIFYFTANEITFQNISAISFIKYFAIGMSVLPLFYIIGWNKTIHDDGRLQINYINPNTISVFLGITIILILYLYHNKLIFGFLKYYLVLLLIPMLYIIVLTGSKGGTISLFLGIFVYYVFKNNQIKFQIKNTIKTIVFISLLGTLFLTNDMLYYRFFEENEKFTDSRSKIWEKVLIIAKQEPIFGVGVFRYSQEMTRIHGKSKATHNEYLTILVYSGLLGLTIFLRFLYLIYISARNTQKNNNSLYLAIFVIVTFTLFKGGGVLITSYMWILFGMIYASGSNLSKSKSDITSASLN